MKLKKILAAALSAAMVLSCMTVSGGNVVQAAGRTTDRGVNIAPNLRIVAYSGNEGNHTIGYVNDRVNNEVDNNDRWQSGVDLKGNAAQGNAAFIVFDLGDPEHGDSVRSFSEIRVRFHNHAYATHYNLLTSDTCEITNDTQLSKNQTPTGWRELDSRAHAENLRPFPENTLVGRTENVGRYLMFFFTRMNSNAGANSVSIREIEIYNKRVQDVTLSENGITLNPNETQRLTATINPVDATQQGLIWSSSNNEVATVDSAGNVTAVATGEAIITVASKDNKQLDATCTVTVTAPVDKTELNALIAKAGELVEGNYTPESWTPFKAALDAAIVIRDKSDASEDEVTNAINTLEGATNKLVRLYKVTVDGKVKASGIYNTIVTLTAPQAESGMKFAGWVLNGKTVSLDEQYKFAIIGDMNFETKYVKDSVEPEKDLCAAIINTEMTKRADKKADVRFIAQLSIPEGSKLKETGIIWTIDDSVKDLHISENRPAIGAKRTASPSVSAAYQFAVKLKGVPEGRTIRGEVYAKVEDQRGVITWIYSEIASATNN